MITQFTEHSYYVEAIHQYALLKQEIEAEVEWVQQWSIAMKQQIDTLFYADFIAEDEE